MRNFSETVTILIIIVATTFFFQFSIVENRRNIEFKSFIISLMKKEMMIP